MNFHLPKGEEMKYMFYTTKKNSDYTYVHVGYSFQDHLFIHRKFNKQLTCTVKMYFSQTLHVKYISLLLCDNCWKHTLPDTKTSKMF